MEFSPANSTEDPLELQRCSVRRKVLTASEQKRNQSEIESISRQLDRPHSEVADLYADVYADFKSRAQVLDYLPVLVARRVRACYAN